ncbi:hypothetical protein IGI04_014278 [Brassica rapa subsp. trilocularis]|uniref:Uncharacterized protein n=1 Tax=Brassica rapa subsp. trilocularis TaxID=1813537 RepID=A0ABQ7MP81_BRACM|nr:hypothetical protein IGI04_014278 [Brassica rapa subsp. trilocularis]
MGFNMLGKWIAEKAQKNKIKVFQDALDAIAESENACLKDAAIELKNSREFGGRYESTHLERKKVFERHANGHAAMRPPLVAELVLFEKLKKIEIEALQNGDFTTQKILTRGLYFLF